MTPADVTQLLRSWQHSDPDALDRLLRILNAHLDWLAHARLHGGKRRAILPDHRIHPRGVHPAGRDPSVPWKNRTYFFALCARLMRCILIDRARARRSERSGGEVRQVQFPDWLGTQPLRSASTQAPR
jgi:RNA polymerase sigma-70 factor (ECF subfamily)